MRPRAFALERYFARHEFSSRYLLGSSDPESMSIADLLALEPGAAEGLQHLWLGYTESAGNPALREAIARLYAKTSAAQILVHAGAQEPIFSFMNLTLAAGDHAIVQFPAYESHLSIAEALGATVTRWRGDPAAHWRLDPDDLPGLLRANTRAIVISSPHNPTGAVIDRERMTAIIAFARTRGLWLFSDEVYLGLEHVSTSIPAVCDEYERGISLGAMAKVYGLGGLRIGWVGLHDHELFEQMAAFKDYTTICNSAPSEYLATLALRHHQRLLARTREILRGNLLHLDAFFARQAGRFEWTRPDGGTTAFPALKNESADAFCARAVEGAGVMLLPSTVFDAGDGHLRFGYGRRNLPEALAALEAHLAKG